MILTLCSAIVLAGCTESREPRLTMISEGREVVLDTEVRQEVIDQVEAIVESANFNSVNHPQYFASDTTPAEAILKNSYLRIEYPSARTFETVGGELSAETVDVGLAVRSVPGPFLLRSGDDLVCISKESGYHCMQLAGLRGFNEHLPAQMRDMFQDFKPNP